MQVFVPHTDLQDIARVLDQRRLNKQLVEADQIIRVILEATIDNNTGDVVARAPKGWRRHPAVLAWRETPEALVRYCYALEQERHSRGYTNPHKSLANMHVLMRYARLDIQGGREPGWWGREEIHASHRAALLWKAPEHYTRFGWTETPKYEYVWPHETERV